MWFSNKSLPVGARACLRWEGACGRTQHNSQAATGHQMGIKGRKVSREPAPSPECSLKHSSSQNWKDNTLLQYLENFLNYETYSVRLVFNLFCLNLSLPFAPCLPVSRLGQVTDTWKFYLLVNLSFHCSISALYDIQWWCVFLFIIAADLFNFKRGLECVLMEGEVPIPSLTVAGRFCFHPCRGCACWETSFWTASTVLCWGSDGIRLQTGPNQAFQTSACAPGGLAWFSNVPGNQLPLTDFNGN